MSWRDVLTVHPAAELFPLLGKDELRELGEDIKKNGLRTHITIWSPDPNSNKVFLLDGRNRLDSMEAVGLPILKDEWKGGGIHQLLFPYRQVYGFGGGIGFDGLKCTADPFEFVISANIHRRHLTAEQRRDLIAKVLKATPGKSNRQIADETKSNRNTVGQIRKKLETSGDVSRSDTRTDRKGRQQPAGKPKLAPVELEPPSVELAVDEDGGVPFVPLVPMSERIKLTRLVFPLLRYVYDKQKAPDWQQTIKDIGADRFGDIVETMVSALVMRMNAEQRRELLAKLQELLQPPKTEADKAKAEAL